MIRFSTLTAALAAALIAVPAAQAGSLTVTIDKISKVEGSLEVAIFDADGYGGGKPVAGTSVSVDASTMTFTFEGIEDGEYGIKLYHDVNGDGKMNTNPFGMPVEPYAFSNDAVGRFGPAKWDSAKFSVSADNAEHTITMK